MACSNSAASVAVSRLAVVRLLRPRGEQHVSALDVGHDIGMAERGHNLSELGHRDLLAAEVVDPAQQRNVSRHASIMSKRQARSRSSRSTC